MKVIKNSGRDTEKVIGHQVPFDPATLLSVSEEYNWELRHVYTWKVVYSVTDTKYVNGQQEFEAF